MLFNNALEISIPEDKIEIVTKQIARVGRELKADIHLERVKQPGTAAFQLSIVALTSNYAKVYYRIGQLFEFYKITKPLT